MMKTRQQRKSIRAAQTVAIVPQHLMLAGRDRGHTCCCKSTYLISSALLVLLPGTPFMEVHDVAGWKVSAYCSPMPPTQKKD